MCCIQTRSVPCIFRLCTSSSEHNSSATDAMVDRGVATAENFLSLEGGLSFHSKENLEFSRKHFGEKSYNLKSF